MYHGLAINARQGTHYYTPHSYLHIQLPSAVSGKWSQVDEVPVAHFCFLEDVHPVSRIQIHRFSNQKPFQLVCPPFAMLIMYWYGVPENSLRDELKTFVVLNIVQSPLQLGIDQIAIRPRA